MDAFVQPQSGGMDLETALALADVADIEALMGRAAALRDAGHGNVISYSRKVFIPLTKLCRDVCHYCTFAQPPQPGGGAYMTPEEVLSLARAGARAGCQEALFTLGDKPELRYGIARDELERMGYATTLDYLAHVAGLVFAETGLFPHLNPGLMTADDMAMLRAASVSQGIMLECLDEALCQPGGPHYGSPDKNPQRRLETIELAGALKVPFTSGILIGIGESRRQRIESLLALRQVHERYGHIQEIIVQNFRAKPGTRMAQAAEPDFAELLWTVAAARLVFGPEMNIQAPPNLSPGPTARLIAAGLNDWGGVSPVTPDFVNPERPWPEIETLARETAAAGHVLAQRLCLYPRYALDGDVWLDERFRTPVLRAIDAQGLARPDPWSPGGSEDLPQERLLPAALIPASTGRCEIATITDKAAQGEDLSEAEIVRLFEARGQAAEEVVAAADRLRARVVGDDVSYAVNRNINYTNVCYFRCGFCAFSKGRGSESLRGRPYDLALDEIARRTREAWQRGATEVCMQGGIHPDYSGRTYLDICAAVREAAPEMHLHAFSPLEITQGAATLQIGVPAFLEMLRDAGLGSLPGTAAEILDDEVRQTLCPDKVDTGTWLEVVAAAHDVGLRSTATIMFGHVDGYRHWARHLLRIRTLQARSGGFTEFVPLPFVHMEAPNYLQGRARRGPTWRESLLMHAVARLALHPHITNIQASWVKLGADGARACLDAGANDLGGTLMNESITRVAGAGHGQEMPVRQMEALIEKAGRRPVQRSTFYGTVPAERRASAFAAKPLLPSVDTPLPPRQRHRGGAETTR